MIGLCKIVLTSTDDPNKRELLRITMALREANKISQSLAKHIVSLVKKTKQKKNVIVVTKFIAT